MSRNLRCLIVDDEKPAHQVIASHIAKVNGLEHKASVYNGKEAIAILLKEEFDIMFLDIEMPLIKGIEVLESVEKKPLTIITTAFSHFAFDAYQNDAIDYLLKPISFERFTKAVLKAKSHYFRAMQQSQAIVKIPVKVNGEMQEIPLGDIKYVQSIGNYIKFFLSTQNEQVVVYGSLINLLKKLPTGTFLQVHKSFVVNKNFIRKVAKEMIVLNCNSTIPVGRRYEVLLSNLELKEE